LTVILTILLILLLPDAYFIAIPALVTVPTIIVILRLEKKRPFRDTWSQENGDRRSDLIRTFITLPTALKMGEWLVPVLCYYPLSLLNFYEINWPNWVQVSVLLLASEFLFYWIHRWSHEKKSLWIFHAIHHGADRVYWGNAGRFHFVDAFLTGLAYAIPIAFLAPSQEAIVILLTLSAISGFMEHINVKFNAGIWNYVFNTAELHRWHHSEVVEESNKNYGKIIVFWDLVFGTHHYKQDRSPVKVGISNTTVPKTYMQQAIYPFQEMNQIKSINSLKSLSQPGDSF
jgi:sterol desaturase/sphingolipid hydroxylase (fatty acid hydroxylase superfamily)